MLTYWDVGVNGVPYLGFTIHAILVPHLKCVDTWKVFCFYKISDADKLIKKDL